MTINIQLENIREKLLKKLHPLAANANEIIIEAEIYHLLLKTTWNEDDLNRLDFISKKIDITKKLFLKYSIKGLKKAPQTLDDASQQSAVVWLLLKVTFLEKNLAQRLKRFNVLFKVMDAYQPTWLKQSDEIKDEIESQWQKLSQHLPQTSNQIKATQAQLQVQHELKELPLTVLFYEGPIARAYLSTLKSLGLKPKKIIELIASHDLITKKPIGKWMPKAMRQSLAASSQRSKIHYWSKQIAKTQTALVDETKSQVHKQWQFSQGTLTEANKLLPLTTYCDNVSSVMMKNLKDEDLLSYLNNEPQGALLYTGGGIVPKKLLSLQHLKFLHIHPGFLPHIRGADCTLWSSLLTGHTSASCFYMAPGIDEGDIVLPCWLPKLTVNHADVKNSDLQTLYRIVYGYIDPWVRAFVLREVINSHSEFENIKSDLQNVDEGVTYHFMHNAVKQMAIGKVFI
jgi:hypothetical protein